MPITKSAKKALRVSKRKGKMNAIRKDALRSSIKAVEKLASQKKNVEASTALPAAFQAIDKALKRGLLKPNTAARRKSRLARLVKKV